MKTGEQIGILVLLLLLYLVFKYFKVVSIAVAVLAVIYLVFLWYKKNKEKKAKAALLEQQRQADDNRCKAIAQEANILKPKIDNVTSLTTLLLLHDEYEKLENESNHFYDDTSGLANNSKQICMALQNRLVEKYNSLSGRYYSEVYAKIMNASSLDELLNLHRQYIQSVDRYVDLKNRLLNALLVKIQGMEIKPSTFSSDVVINGRPCYLKSSMYEIPIRRKGNEIEYRVSEAVYVTVYLFENKMEVKTPIQHYGILFNNILETSIDNGKLRLHLRGNGGLKGFAGDMMPVLYAVIKNLQTKAQS